jgi:hypothetical protein
VPAGTVLTSMVEQRNVVVPDLGDEFVAVLSDLTETLIALVDDTLDSELPSVLADGFGLEALDRISPLSRRGPAGIQAWRPASCLRRCVRAHWSPSDGVEGE